MYALPPTPITTNTACANTASTAPATNTWRRPAPNSRDWTSRIRSIITCHIGNGASVTAVLNGKSFDTSMGFSPVDGLVTGHPLRATYDPSAVTFIGEKEGMSYAELNEMMNKKSGVLGLTDLSSDMRDIDRAYDEGDPRAILARDMPYGRIRRFVGEYADRNGRRGHDRLHGRRRREFVRDARERLHGSRNHGRRIRPRGQQRRPRRKQNPLHSRFARQSGRRSPPTKSWSSLPTHTIS